MARVTQPKTLYVVNVNPCEARTLTQALDQHARQLGNRQSEARNVLVVVDHYEADAVRTLIAHTRSIRDSYHAPDRHTRLRREQFNVMLVDYQQLLDKIEKAVK